MGRWRGLVGATLLAILPLAGSAQAPLPPAHRPSIRELMERATADSNDALAHIALGEAYAAAKHFDDGDRELREAVALAPQNAEAYLALSRLPAARGEEYWKKREKQIGPDSTHAVFNEAYRFYRRAFLLDPFVDLEVAAEPERPHARNTELFLYAWWYRGWMSALGALRAGRYEQAVADFTAIVADPRSDHDLASLPSRLLWFRGLAAARAGQYDLALSDLGTLTGRTFAAETTQAGGGRVSANDYRYALATVRFLAGHYNEAIATYRRTLEFDLGLYQAHMQMARIYEASKHWDEAIAERKAAMAVNPDDGSLMVDLGATLLAASRLDDAEAILIQAEAVAPRDPRAPFLLGTVALRNNHRETAHSAFARFLAIAPSRFADQITEVRETLATIP